MFYIIRMYSILYNAANKQQVIQTLEKHTIVIEHTTQLQVPSWDFTRAIKHIPYGVQLPANSIKYMGFNSLITTQPINGFVSDKITLNGLYFYKTPLLHALTFAPIRSFSFYRALIDPRIWTTRGPASYKIHVGLSFYPDRETSPGIMLSSKNATQAAAQCGRTYFNLNTNIKTSNVKFLPQESPLIQKILYNVQVSSLFKLVHTGRDNVLHHQPRLFQHPDEKVDFTKYKGLKIKQQVEVRSFQQFFELREDMAVDQRAEYLFKLNNWSTAQCHQAISIWNGNPKGVRAMTQQLLDDLATIFNNT